MTRLSTNLAAVLALLLPALNLHATDAEFRGFWVDAFHPGFKNSEEVARLLADVRAANCNAIIVQVRRRGDAYYNSNIEPKAADVDADYDPLADILGQARDPEAGPPIEVHAWMNVYPIWFGGDGSSAPHDHPFSQHPDWLSRDVRGQTYDGRNYSFDPGHPEVQEHIFNVAMDILGNYDIDGLNLDYVRYSGKVWGYNPVSVNRFNQLYSRTGQPSQNDPAWSQFRRDQVTGLVRRIYLSAIEIKPHLKISAATIAWAPAPAEDGPWGDRIAAHSHLFQDWRGWMEEGIIDINLPMLYLRQDDVRHANWYRQWIQFAGRHAYNRQVVVSPALYMNTVSNSAAQIRIARQVGGEPFAGVCLYSYANYSTGQGSREAVLAALTQTGRERPESAPVFAKAVAIPELPWKTRPSTGHLKGFVFGKRGKLDGATVSVSGADTRKLRADATGFYGTVDLPPGEYSITVSATGYDSATQERRVSVGKVTTLDVHLTETTSP